VSALPPPHRLTTAELGAVHPFTGTALLPAQRVLVGLDSAGRAFCFDPFELYCAGVLTNPNVAVIGQVGRGKSSLVKALVSRLACFGVSALVVDPKGEYRPLAEALGGQVVTLRPDEPSGVNPLAGLVAGGGAHEAALDLVVAIAEAGCRRPLGSLERRALGWCLRRAVVAARAALREATLDDVVVALGELLGGAERPSELVAAALPSERAGLRDLGFELGRLSRGDLGGLFGPGQALAVASSCPLVVVDLSAMRASAALPAAMAATLGWMRSWVQGGRGRHLLVVDEAWALLAHERVAAWLRGTWKLARSLGLANVAVVHRVSDFDASAAAGSTHALAAAGVLADTETRVVFAQPPDELGRAQEALGLNEAEVALLGRLPRGWSVWKVGDRTFVVRLLLSRFELALTDTDGRMGPDRVPGSDGPEPVRAGAGRQ
jgi:type IV secretory pathway VirB4 component